MANECEWTYLSSIALETSGGTVADAGFDAGDGSSITSGSHGDWPLCDLVLYVPGFASALAGWQTINVYRRDMDLLGGTEDQIVPTAVVKHLYVGSFPLQQSNATNSAGYIQLSDVPLSQACMFYIENAAGQTLNAGWGLWCRPKTYTVGS